MRRNWIKIYVDQCLRGTMMKELPYDERWLWFGLLLLAGDSPVEGKVCVTDHIGYSDDQIAALLESPLTTYLSAKEKMIRHDKISVNSNGIIKITNWEKYQSEYYRQKKFRSGKVTEQSDDAKLQAKAVTKSDDTDIDKDKDKERDKELTNTMCEKDPYKQSFNAFWKEWPADRRTRKQLCKQKFDALCKRGELDKFKKACRSYAAFLDYQKNERGFDQTPMFSSTFLNNWMEWYEKDFEHTARL